MYHRGSLQPQRGTADEEILPPDGSIVDAQPSTPLTYNFKNGSVTKLRNYKILKQACLVSFNFCRVSGRNSHAPNIEMPVIYKYKNVEMGGGHLSQSTVLYRFHCTFVH